MEEDDRKLLLRLIGSFDSLTDQLCRLNTNVERYNDLYPDDEFGGLDLNDVEFDGMDS